MLFPLAVPSPPVPWAAIVARFLAAAHGASPRTAVTYRRHLQELAAELAGELPSLEALQGYRDRLLADGRSPATHRQALAAVRGFLAWLDDLARAEGSPPPVPLEAFKRLLRAPRGRTVRPLPVVADREAAALLAGAPTLRDRALLAVLLGGGLRVAELVGLDVADVLEPESATPSLWVRHGKGGTSRTVPIRDDVAAALAAYLTASGRTWESPGPLFLRLPRRGGRPSPSGRLTPRAVEHRLRQLARVAGLTGKSMPPHALRHAYALRFLRRTGNVKALQLLLGHASIETTERYLRHLEVEELRADLPALPGPDRSVTVY